MKDVIHNSLSMEDGDGCVWPGMVVDRKRWSEKVLITLNRATDSLTQYTASASNVACYKYENLSF